MVTKENLLICSLRWSEGTNHKNGFFPFEKQYEKKGLNYRVFVYDRDEEKEKEFIEKYNWLGDYIYYRVYKLYDSLLEEIRKNKWEYVVFLDYNDTFFCGSPDELIDKLNGFDSNIVFGCEKNLFPARDVISTWDFPFEPGEPPYVNGGMFFGRSESLLEMFDEVKKIAESHNCFFMSEQGIYHVLHRRNDLGISLDFKNNVFYNLVHTQEGVDYNMVSGRLRVNETGTSPCFLHQNGIWDEKTGLYPILYNRYNIDTTRLSIVTSYYNSESFIDEQSDSILSQSYQNWEWIICDDFSTDSTKKKLMDLAKKDPRIRLVEPRYKKEIWWNPQTYATGDIVCPIDGDDKILPGTFEKIVHYFDSFPDVVLLHFNANKYNNILPTGKDSLTDYFHDNVYISRDNISFLDAFERLHFGRSSIFGYLRIFRNLPELKFPVHQDGDACSSNDGQWLLMLEERGKSLAIPRTTYLARQHVQSENFRNWNIRGEAQLITDAQKRREGKDLEMPRISDYFNEIYVAAESTYLSQLNWESERKRVCFFNFGYSERQKRKMKELFFDHDLFFDSQDRSYDYSFIRIKQDTDSDSVLKLLGLATGRVNLFCDNVHLHQNNRTGRNTLEEIKNKISTRYPFYWNVQENRAIIYLFTKIPKHGENFLQDMTMEEVLINGYSNAVINPQTKRSVENEAFFNFVDGPRVTINGPKQANYNVKFIDQETNREVYVSSISNNCWCACSIKYAMDWRIEIYEDGKLWKTHIFNPEGKRVYVHLDSNSLGDSLAWFPLVEEYRKQKNCTMICSTHRNYFFQGLYPEIEFVEPGTVVHNLYACFGIGWYYKEDGEIDKYKNPYDFKMFPLQQTASDILNIKFQEVKPLINVKDLGRKVPGNRPYICIAPHASALAKYWNLPGGWQSLVDYIREQGYDVVMITQEPLGDAWHDSKLGGTLKGVINKTGDFPLEERANDLLHSSGFIGVGSGLSWLAWAIGTPVLMISGFSEEWTEFQTGCVRIINDTGCRGCFNRSRLDPSDWNWCPDHKGTPRQFECSKLISVDKVIDGFKKMVGSGK